MANRESVSHQRKVARQQAADGLGQREHYVGRDGEYEAPVAAGRIGRRGTVSVCVAVM